MEYTASNKQIVQILVEKCHSFGIKQVVLCPGSRNAPLIISFANHPGFTCYSIIDERSAGFYALGLARQLHEPVAVVCTSGTAVLNLAPALAEAYYQEISLVAITADRPAELIGQEDGQTIRQSRVFQKFVSHSIDLPVDETEELKAEASNYLERMFKWHMVFPGGPMHINVPLREPLYETTTCALVSIPKSVGDQQQKIETKIHKQLIEEWSQSAKILIVCGIYLPDEELNQAVNQLVQQKNIPVIASANSNLSGKGIIHSVEKLLLSLTSDDELLYRPDLLITIGGPVVSKRIKEFLRKVKPALHWDVDLSSRKVDTYNCLTKQVTGNPFFLFKYLNKKVEAKNETYLQTWVKANAKQQSLHDKFIMTVPWSDFMVYHTFFAKIAKPLNLHTGNSSPVRYIEFFRKNPFINYYSNRGTSGIDGSSSTAAGAALADDKLTVLITGDVAFIYDSNALWFNQLPKNLRILVINNNGGNIFRLIPGPANSGHLPLFETPHHASVKMICKAFHVYYLKASNEIELNQMLPSFLDTNAGATVLEVFTPAEVSAEVYKNYLQAH